MNPSEHFHKIHKTAMEGYWIPALHETTKVLKEIQDGRLGNMVFRNGELEDLEENVSDYRTTIIEWLRVTPQPYKPFEAIEAELIPLADVITDAMRVLYEQWIQEEGKAKAGWIREGC